MTSIIDYRFPSSTGQCVKLNFGEPCVAIVNSPYRNCFFVLGAGDRGASSCLFSSLWPVVSDNISPLFGQGGGICWKSADKATSFSSVAVNIASSVQKVSYSKPFHIKSRCFNTTKSFLALKVISIWIFVYFQKSFTMKLWQNTQFTTAILFYFIFTA